ncbi:21237_t:CDS:2, partial [Dentiscutata erythropus]
IHSDYNLESRKEAQWKLTNKLLEAFNLSDLATHRLFQNTTQNYSERFYRLFVCYNIAKTMRVTEERAKKTKTQSKKKRANEESTSNLHITYEKESKKRKISDNNGDPGTQYQN